MPVPECAEGWMNCFPDQPCPRHVDYWKAAANNQAPQPPQMPTSESQPRHLGNPVSIPSPIEKVEKIFTYQTPDPEKVARYNAIRIAARVLAMQILNHTPQCADQTAAIRKVREAVYTANAAIALDGLV